MNQDRGKHHQISVGDLHSISMAVWTLSACARVAYCVERSHEVAEVRLDFGVPAVLQIM